MECKKCGSKYVVNKFHQLCDRCNKERLHGNKFGKTYKHSPKNKSGLKLSKNASHKIKVDEEYYEKIFNMKPNLCEECLCQLPQEFRDSEGKVIARWQYSHILPKSTYPEHRHNLMNMNRLCLKHHEKWENGDKKSMRIWKGNVELCLKMGVKLKNSE